MKNIEVVDGLEINPNLGSLDAGDPVVAVRIMTDGYGCAEDTERAINMIQSDWLEKYSSRENTIVQMMYELNQDIGYFHYYYGCIEYNIFYVTLNAYREIEPLLVAEGFVKTAMCTPCALNAVLNGKYFENSKVGNNTTHWVGGFRLPYRADCPDKGVTRMAIDH
jgi:hypothetical protein